MTHLDRRNPNRHVNRPAPSIATVSLTLAVCGLIAVAGCDYRDTAPTSTAPTSTAPTVESNSPSPDPRPPLDQGVPKDNREPANIIAGRVIGGTQLGVTHAHSTYHLTEQPILLEGANQARQLGLNVIKLYFYLPPAANNILDAYSLDSAWPKVTSLVELAQTDYFRQVFDMPFDTYVLTVFAAGRRENYWLDGVDDQQLADETHQFQQLAEFFLNEYAGTGKTFIFSHWEGDWAVRGNFDRRSDPSQDAIQAMIAWLNARQAGVDQAREQRQADRVSVFHAAEVNLVDEAMRRGRACVVNRVLPHVNVDLVSYSAYDTQERPQLLKMALDYISKHTRHRAPFQKKNVYLGEFGLPENEVSTDKLKTTIEGTLHVARDWKCPYAIYWQLYCNEKRQEVVGHNDDVKGFYLVRPDGTTSGAWNILRDVSTPSSMR